MASVKASENQSTVLATLPSTLLFDTFKSSREDEKDSDEESFHLPLLDCDEDLQLDKSSTQPAESEEDILNKFEAGTSEAPIADSNVESAQEAPEPQNSTNEDTGKIDDTVVGDSGENVCENDGNNAEVMEENYEDATDDAANDNNTKLVNEKPAEETEEPSSEIPTENSDPVNDEMPVVDNETLTNESPIVDNTDNETNVIPVGDDQNLNEDGPLKDDVLLNNDADNEQTNFDNITTECDEPVNTETLAENNEQINDEIATVEDHTEMGDELENHNGDDKINTVVPGENEELNETDVNHPLDNEPAVECSEASNEDNVSKDNIVSPKTDKLEEEEQLESLLSQSESTGQTYMNETSNLDDEEASLKDLVDNINVRMDDNDDDLEMNDDLMSGVSGSKMSEGAHDGFTEKVDPIEDADHVEASIGVEVQDTEDKNDKLSEDSEAIEKVPGDMKEGDNFENNVEAMDTEEHNELVEGESEQESNEKVCTMDVEDEEEPMLVDNDDEDHEDAEKIVQNGLIEDEASEIEQEAESCKALADDEVVKDIGNIPQTELSKDPLIEEAEVGQETESCKELGIEEIGDAEKNTQLSEDPPAEKAFESEQETDSCKALDQGEIIEDAEDNHQDELLQDPLAESALELGQETENSEALGEDDVVEDAEEMFQTELNKDPVEKVPETEQQTENCEALGENDEEIAQSELSREPLAENATEIEQEGDNCEVLGKDFGESHQTELPQDHLAEKFSEMDQEMEICKDLDKEKGHDECEEKNSTDVDKTEDSSKEYKEATKTDTVSEIKETAEAPSAEDEHSKKESDAVPEDKKNEPETKEEDSSDNLLDISVIRDVDEDNATAIAEQAAESQSSEKSDNDELDQEDDKTDDVDDSEPDHEADKDETMDFEEDDDTANVNDSVIEDTCDSDALKIDAGDESLDKARTDTPLSEEDIPLSERLSAKQSEERKKQAESEPAVDTTLTPEADKVDVQPEPAPVTPTSSVPDTVTPITEESTKGGLALQKKRSLSPVPQNEIPSKKIRLSEEKVSQEETVAKTEEPKEPKPSNKIKALLSFQKYMQNKKITDKLSRSDLEQLCIQKICEAIIHKTDVGELHQTVKKQEQLIENLRKDLQTLSKQTRDLDIVNKKLMNELKTQNYGKKPIVPLKITRSVGLQVKLSMGAEPTRRKSTSTTAASSTPPKTPSSPLANRTRNVQTNAAGSSVLRAIAPAQSPVRSPASQTTTTPILTKALTSSQQATQQRSPLVTHSSPASPMKRGPIRKSPGMSDPPKVQNNTSPLKQAPNKASPMKPSQPGVIDLTDEDDRVAAPKTGGPAKTVRGVPITSPQPKANGAPTKGAVQPKNVVKVGQQGTTPGRTVAGLPQGVRLTTNQVKNGIAIPVSTGSTTQLMYVVQPSSTANSNQKTLTLLNLPTQQLLTSMNGSTMSMISSKSPGTVQVKQLPTRRHPAPLPLPPVMPVNSTFKPVLPKPHLSIRKTDNGIILQWRMPYNLDLYESIASYQLFAYQETNAPPSTEMWRKVGDVKALALPMACTLTQFADKNKYYFAVRSVDVHKRIGEFSDPEEISL